MTASIIPAGILAMMNGDYSPVNQNAALGGDPRTRRLSGLIGAMQAPQIQQTPQAAPQLTQLPAPLGPDDVQAAGGARPTLSLMDRVKQMLMPAQPGMDQILTPDDQSAARHRGLLDFGLSLLASSHGQGGGNAPSLGQALLGGVQAMRQGYGDSTNSAVQGRMTGMQLGMQQHVLQARQAIGTFLQQHMSADPATQMAALRQAYQMAIAVGDTDMAKTLSPMLEKDVELGAKPYEQIPLGGSTMLLDPRTHRPVIKLPHDPTPMSPEAIGFRQDAADARRESLDARKEQQQAMREQRLVQQYETMSKPFAQAAINVQALNENRKGAMMGDPIAQQTALQDFIKLNLPGQMVTAGELHQYASLMGLGDRGEQILKRLESGTPLSTQQMRLIYQHADGLVKARRQAANYLRQQMIQRAAQYGVDPMAFVDHFGFLPPEGGEAPAPTGASAVDRHLRKDY